MGEYLTNSDCLTPYMVFPRFLLDIDISETARILYMLLLDRARLSLKSDKWTDCAGHTFLYFPVRELSETLRKSEMTVKSALATLEQAGLIERVKQGAGKPSRIYVKVPSGRDRKLSHGQTENHPSEGQKTVSLTDRKLSPNKNNKHKTMESNNGYRDYSCSEDESL